MNVQVEHPAEEIKRLQRCMNDLLSVLALPAMWSGAEPVQIAHTLMDALLEMLYLDLVYVQLNNPLGGAPIEMARVDRSLQMARKPPLQAEQIAGLLKQSLGDDPQEWPPLGRNRIAEEDISLAALRLGPHGEIGVVVAGSRRPEFPGQTEKLVLSVTANQASIGIQEASLLGQQRRVASELDQRVVQRTAELAAANEELKRELAERQLAEAKLRRSEAFLAEGQHLARVGSFSWRAATDELTWSEELYRIFEFEDGTPQSIERVYSRVHPEDIPSLREMVERARRDASDIEYGYRLLMPDRSVKYVNMVAHAIRDKEGRLEYIGAVQDVTLRRSSENALSKARSELTHVTRITSLGVLTASIAHEVNQPLSGIITNASTCLRMLAADPPNLDGARETARRTIRDGNRASEVITRLRALYGKKGPTTEPVDLNEATREVLALCLSELQSSRVIVRPEFGEELPPVNGDRVQLQQVILNLIRNASDAMSAIDDHPRELVIRTERDEADRVRLTVQDAGAGFDPQSMDRLFESFYTTKNDGMGIGLSVSRSIIENHHGRLWATLNQGPGASFSFSIPCAPESSTRADSLRNVRKPAETDAA